MKMITLVTAVSFLVLSGLALASQSGEQKDRPSMMEEMTKGRKEKEHMGGMMRMMKMMERCGAMMEQCCSPADSGKQKENPKQ